MDCPDPTPTLSTTSTYAPNSTYQTNLDALFSVLSTNTNASNGFYNYTAGSYPPNIAYGLFLCRGYVSASACRVCVVYAIQKVVKLCPRSKRITIWYDVCMLRYSNVSIFAAQDRWYLGILKNGEMTVTNGIRFNEVLGEVLL
ncbi:hypothetical protein C3L33_22714, partial [Rhododendron williamsianum]